MAASEGDVVCGDTKIDRRLAPSQGDGGARAAMSKDSGEEHIDDREDGKVVPDVVDMGDLGSM
jgi:hypothetical protein